MRFPEQVRVSARVLAFRSGDVKPLQHGAVEWPRTETELLETTMANKKPETRLAGRSAETGQFKTVQAARNAPRTSVVERLPLPGKGRK